MKVSREELRAFAATHLPDIEPPTEQPKADPLDPLRNLPKRHVCLALLSYDAKTFCRNSMAITDTAAKCGALGWGFSYILREADSMVARGRSQLASRFLADPSTAMCTDLVLVDTDVYYDSDEMLKLLSHEVDVVCGAYPFKNESGNFPLRWSSQGLIEDNGLWIVQASTPGFMRIRRSALERIVAEMPWLEYTDPHGDAAHRCWMFFDNLHRSNGIYDEGYVFCERWRGVGGTVYIDPTLHLKHIGLKIYDHGTLKQWNDIMTEEVEKLHKKFPNVSPSALFNKLQATRLHWRTLREMDGHLEKMRAMEAELAKEQAEAVKSGAPIVRLEGVEYPENRKLEGEDVPEEAGETAEVHPGTTSPYETGMEPGSQSPPPGARPVRKGANGAAVPS